MKLKLSVCSDESVRRAAQSLPLAAKPLGLAPLSGEARLPSKNLARAGSGGQRSPLVSLAGHQPSAMGESASSPPADPGPRTNCCGAERTFRSFS